MRGIKGRKNQSETCQQKEANKTSYSTIYIALGRKNSDYPLFTRTLPVVSTKTNDRFLLNAGLGSTEALYV
jgi:hypothetical protein